MAAAVDAAAAGYGDGDDEDAASHTSGHTVGLLTDSGYGGSIGGMPFPSDRSTHTQQMQTIKADSSLSNSDLGETVSMRTRQRPRNRRVPSPPPARYQDEEQRLQSFRGACWPNDIPQPQQLAKAGLYYVGPTDRVKCAFCGGKLKNWVADDVAESEHYRHFPHCTFIQSMQQKLFLSKSMRKESKKEQCTTSDILIQQAATEREQKGRLGQKNLAVRTLMKMGYLKAEIQRARRHLESRKFEPAVDLEELLEELQRMERDTFMGVSWSPDGNVETDCVEKKAEDDDSPNEDVDTGLSDDEYISGQVDEGVMNAITLEDVAEQLEEKLRVMTREKEEIVNLITCKVCLVARVNTVFLTCRHLVTCKDCADRVNDCPVCRKVILGTVDVFMD